MFRFLLIVTLVVYGIYKIGKLFFRAGAASQMRQQPPINPPPTAKPRPGSIKGGEYVDYEEVK
ncbi:MAG: DUF4834 family protein [Cyclobacteriaceae bacterium]|jgi:hypothetical protein|nr:DUF4834 family protein [Cyclobacteriaceae bacterium]